jgi:protein tyrosine phosphatase
MLSAVVNKINHCICCTFTKENPRKQFFKGFVKKKITKFPEQDKNKGLNKTVVTLSTKQINTEKSQKASDEQPPNHSPEQPVDNFLKSSEESLSVKEKPMLIDMATFRCKIQDLMKQNHAAIYQQLENMQDVYSHLTTIDGLINGAKNRWSNIPPWDQTRIGTDIKRYPEGYYLSGNYVQFNEQLYLQTQAPLPECMENFWRALIVEDARMIVVLTKELENNRIKAHPYWDVKQITTINDWTIEPLNREMTPPTFQLKNATTGEFRVIEFFHFEEWPDHGVPEKTEGLKNFIEQFMKSQGDKKNPIAVHCSGGIGRASTAIIIHAVVS